MGDLNKILDKKFPNFFGDWFGMPFVKFSSDEYHWTGFDQVVVPSGNNTLAGLLFTQIYVVIWRPEDTIN